MTHLHAGKQSVKSSFWTGDTSSKGPFAIAISVCRYINKPVNLQNIEWQFFEFFGRPFEKMNWLIKYQVVVSNIFYVHPHFGKISNVTNIFQMGWNQQPEYVKQENPNGIAA